MTYVSGRSYVEKNVQRLYWVQFEGYLPTKPELRYKYDSPQHVKIGGMDFYVDTWRMVKKLKRGQIA